MVVENDHIDAMRLRIANRRLVFHTNIGRHDEFNPILDRLLRRHQRKSIVFLPVRNVMRLLRVLQNLQHRLQNEHAHRPIGIVIRHNSYVLMRRYRPPQTRHRLRHSLHQIRVEIIRHRRRQKRSNLLHRLKTRFETRQTLRQKFRHTTRTTNFLHIIVCTIEFFPTQAANRLPDFHRHLLKCLPKLHFRPKIPFLFLHLKHFRYNGA